MTSVLCGHQGGPGTAHVPPASPTSGSHIPRLSMFRPLVNQGEGLPRVLGPLQKDQKEGRGVWQPLGEGRQPEAAGGSQETPTQT